MAGDTKPSKAVLYAKIRFRPNEEGALIEILITLA